jgi:hypothetical protein
MDIFDNNNNKNHRVSAPKGMYAEVRERIIKERIRSAKMHKQLVIGSALLLLIGILNVSLIVFFDNKKPIKIAETTVEQSLYNTYFDTQNTLSK